MNSILLERLAFALTHQPYNRELPSTLTVSYHQPLSTVRSAKLNGTSTVVIEGWGSVKIQNTWTPCIRTATPVIFHTPVEVRCISAQVGTTCLIFNCWCYRKAAIFYELLLHIPFFFLLLAGDSTSSSVVLSVKVDKKNSLLGKNNKRVCFRHYKDKNWTGSSVEQSCEITHRCSDNPHSAISVPWLTCCVLHCAVMMAWFSRADFPLCYVGSRRG